MGKVGWRRLLSITAAGVALTLVLAGASLADHGYSGNADAHATIHGNPNCSSIAGSFTSLKIDGSGFGNGTYGTAGHPNLITISDYDSGVPSFSWSLHADALHDFDMAAVIVKGGPNAVVYVYDYLTSGTDDSDSGLTTPINPNGAGPKFYGLSHVEFCFDPKGGGGPPPPIPAKLTVNKVCEPSNDPGRFDLRVDGDVAATGLDVACGGTTGTLQLEPGTHTVSETGGTGTNLSDYTSATGGDCDTNGSVAIAAGESKTCTITNTRKPPPPAKPKLRVKKVVVGANNSPSDFEFTVGGQTYDFEADGDNLLELDSGTYDVTEPAVDGFTTTREDCDEIVLSTPQQSVPTCTITNTKDEEPPPPAKPKLRVKKVVVGANNPVTDFTFRVNGGAATAFQAGGTELTLSEGDYEVVETTASGWSTSYSADCEGTLEMPQETVPVCTVTNTKQTTPPPPPPSNPPPSSPPPPPATVTPSIDVAIVKDATTPTQLNGTVTYTLQVTNVGGTTATDVQLGDPAPAGVTYTSAQSPAGVSCSVSTALVTCSRPGPFSPGATFTVTVLGKAIQTGTHINTATVTAGGGSEANLANNTDSAATLVVAPVTPPKAKPKPKPKPVRKPQATICTSFTIVQNVINAGQPSRLAVRVTKAGRGVLGAKVRLKGPGVDKTVRSAKNGWAITRVNAAKPGILVVRLASPKSCTPGKRVGVVGVFQPPVTG